MILIDYSQFIIASVVVATSNLDKNDLQDLDINSVRYIFLESLINTKKKYHKDYGDIVICCDSKNVWRTKHFPYYKYNRKKMKDAEDTAINWKIVYESVSILIEELKEHFPYKVVHVDYAEGDDVIASLVKWSQTNNLVQEGLNIFLDGEPQKILILSSDNDFKQLQIYKNVTQYSYLLKKFVKEPNPKKYLFEKIIRGDVGDGIPNIYSEEDSFVIGKRQKPIRSNNIDIWYEQKIPDFMNDEFKKERFLKNKKLIDLIEEIPDDIYNNIINEFENVKTGNKKNLLNYMVTNKIQKLIDHIEYL